MTLSGCASVPAGRAAIDDVTLLGADALGDSEVKGALATEPSPKFLGVLRGFVYDYAVFDRATLQRDLARLERYYHARGYYSAHARAGRVLPTGPGHVRVEIVVEEGQPTVNGELTVDGLDGLPPSAATAAREAARLDLPAKKPFDEAQGDKCEADTRKALTDLGYAYAAVKRDTYVDIVRHVANTRLVVVPGAPARFGAITVEGLDPDGPGPRRQEIPEGAVRRAIDLKEGAPYSTAAIDAAVQALLDLEVFAAVTIVPDLSNPATRLVPLRVQVRPSRLREVTLGGGLELDEIKTELRGILGWEDHDFLGGLRDFSVNFQPGVVFYPTRVDEFDAPDHFFPEEKLRAELKQPGFLEARTEGFVRPEFNVFPLLVQTNPAPSDPVVGYREGKGAVGVDRTFFKKLYASLSLDAQVEDPFSYKDPLDPDLSTLVIVYPEFVTRLDLRDDHDHPHAGVYIANSLQIAGGFFGGETRDIKVQPEVRTYLPLAKKVTLATRASIGMLFPQDYGTVVENQLDEPVTAMTPPEVRRERVSDIERVLFRGFFSGGPSSNRGFPIRGVSPHGIVPFLNPSTASQQVMANCPPPSAENGYAAPKADVCSVPIGGFTLWELSNEVRFDVKGPISAAIFCDMGDVSPHPITQPQSLRIDHLHLSCGVGARYDTPVGPIRLDVGYRVQPLQVLGFRNEAAAYEHDPSNGLQPTTLGVPIATAIGIGEAY